MDLSEYISSNRRNLLRFSEIPPVCLERSCALGIDEAGRGPVLGPMVYACAFCPVEDHGDEGRLRSLGVDDSKALTEEQRESLLAKLTAASEFVGWAVSVLSPDFISTGMHRRGKYNLNAMSHDAAIELIEVALARGVRVAKVFVDTVGPPDKYKAKLQAVFPELEITVAKKADSLYASVSAASICAKVARDSALKNWRMKELGDGVDVPAWGSGYPGDPVTKKFLREYVDPVFGFPSLVRFSWKTAEKVLDELGLPVEFEEVEPEEEESVKKNPSVKDYFFSAKKETKKAARTHPYFLQKGLRPGSLF